MCSPGSTASPQIIRIPAVVRKKAGKCRHNFKSAASITLMSTSREPPERLAEILLEILALSKPTPTSQWESVSDSDPIESCDAHCMKEQSQWENEEDNNGQKP